MAPRPVVVDCDPGVDDAIALLLALASPEEIDLVGVTTVAGNVPLARTAANARRVLELAGRTDVPVYAGCDRPMLRPLVTAEHVHGETGLDGADLPPPAMPLGEAHAVDFLAEAVDAAAGGLTLCPIGPLTNVAHALVHDPNLATRLREIVLMGGAIGAGNVTPAAEFNIHADPHAAAVVFGAGARITMIGLDATRQALATPARLEAIRAIGNPVGDAVCGWLERYPVFRDPASAEAGAPLHDPCVIARLLRPELFGGRDAHVTVETTREEAIGRTHIRFRAARPNAHVIEHIDADGFFTLLTERLARL